MTQLWRKIYVNNISTYWCVYFAFVILRVVLVFIPQFGYVHPDEFFQTIEVINGDHFHLVHERTWEFNNTMPVRSITLQFLLLRIPWCFMEVAATYIKYYLQINVLCGYTLLVFPRFIYCVLSFLNDWAMYKICHMYNLQKDIRLMVLSSSWVILIFATRTFSNTLEMCLSSLLLYYVAECMIQTNAVLYKKAILERKYNQAISIGERVKIWKMKNALPAHNFKRFFTTSSLCVAGLFNRPTFLLFGGPIVFYWLIRGLGTKTVTFLHFHLRMILFCLSALPAIIIFILCDSLYYRHLTAGEIQTFHIGLENFVFTPWNFLKYNLNPSNTGQHGVHPKYLHIVVNMPLLYNVLGIMTIVTFLQFFWNFLKAKYQNLPKAQSLVGLMLASIFIPLVGLSLFNHQEARFLIPVTFPIVLLYATKLQSRFCKERHFAKDSPILKWFYQHSLSTETSAKYLLKCWFLCNMLLTVFFGFIHQGGVYSLAQHFEQLMKLQINYGIESQQLQPQQQQQQHDEVHIHLIASHIYKIPLTLINMPATSQMYKNHFNKRQKYKSNKPQYNKHLHVHDFGSSLDMLTLIEELHTILLYQCEFKRKEHLLQQQLFSYRLFLAVPTTLNYKLLYSLKQINASQFLQYKLIKQFYPHLSTEALPAHPFHMYSSCFNYNIQQQREENDNQSTLCLSSPMSLSTNFLWKILQQFSLSLYEFQLKSSQDNSTDILKDKSNHNPKCYNLLTLKSGKIQLEIDKKID